MHRACVEIDRLTHASKHAWKNALSLSLTHTHRGAVGIIGHDTSNLPLPAFLDSTFPGYHLASSKRTCKEASDARTHTHAHARTHARTHARARAHTHTHTNTHTHMHTHTSMSTQTHISHVCLCCLRTYIETAMHHSQTCTRVPATMSAASVPPPSDSESGRLLCFF